MDRTKALNASATMEAAGAHRAPGPLNERALALDPATSARLRALARLRRRYAACFLVAPLLLIIALDARVRGDRLLLLTGKHIASYLGAMVESATLWGLLLYTASARRGAFRWFSAALFVVLATVSLGCQIYFHRQYATYLNLDATLFGTSLGESLLGQLRADGEHFVRSVIPPLGMSIALVWLGRRVVRTGRTRRAVAAQLAVLPAVVAVFVIPCSYRTVQASTPDVIYFHAIGGLIKELTGVHTTAQIRPGLRSPPPLPSVTSAMGRHEPGRVATMPRRNVLFVLTESVRADATCSAPAEAPAQAEPRPTGAGRCPWTPRIDEVVPGRMPLTQMRASSSTTAIELAVLWSGLQPIARREDMHAYPLVFDYAHAAGIQSAYWTSHHMMFANSRLYVQDLPTSHQCGATELDPLADIDVGADDRLLAARVKSELAELREPFFAVAHFGNTHVPYLVDPEDAPFQPALESKAPDENEAYHNYYRNAVFRQDAAIAEVLRFVRSSHFGERTVIVFTSDHGEAFREHGQLGHTGSIFDEEVHVPGWIDAPPGTLTAPEVTAIRAARDELVAHTDIAPTLLDLMGLWDEPAFARYREAMVGQSLLRPRKEPAALALTNCTGIWGCAFKNWGMMRGRLKLEARAWDTTWHCYDVLADPREQRDLGVAACGDLPSLADAIYGGPPGSVDVPLHLRGLAAPAPR